MITITKYIEATQTIKKIKGKLVEAQNSVRATRTNSVFIFLVGKFLVPLTIRFQTQLHLLGLRSRSLYILPLLALWAGQLHAGTFGVYGPEAFIRTKSEAPDVFTATFPVLNPNSTYTLKVYNGGIKGQMT